MQEERVMGVAPVGKSSRVTLMLGGSLFAAVAVVAWLQHSESKAVRAELKLLSERLAAVSASADASSSMERDRTEAMQSAVATLRSDVIDELSRQRSVTEALQTEVKRSLEKVVSDSLDGRNSLAAQFTQSSAVVQAELQRQATDISSLDKEVRRALGHVVIEEAPPDLVVAVGEALKRWLPENGGPGIPESSDEIRSDIASLEQSMGTGLDKAFRSEVNQLSWWADAVDLHHAVGNQLDRAPSVYEWAQSLRLSAPLRVPKWAFAAVLASERKASIEIARLAVSKPFTNSDEIDAAVAVLDQLARELGPDAPAFIVEERQKLVAKGKELEDQNLGQMLTVLKAQRATAVGSAGNERIKLQVQAGFDGQIMGLLSSIGDVTPARRKEIEGLLLAWQTETRALESRIHQREMLRYQVWALEQVDSCEKALSGCRTQFGMTWAVDEVCIQRLMSTYLVPIDTNLLQPPVQERFNKVWSSAKGDLDDPEINDLLRSVSTTPKKGLGEV